jgi:hypothetical protein
MAMIVFSMAALEIHAAEPTCLAALAELRGVLN